MAGFFRNLDDLENIDFAGARGMEGEIVQFQKQ
jgi:hypothetical protein